ncbi:hypothetical protein EIN_413790 [Entamoeba invadens IP1]|uniref:Uncharacterized protein n=1 Tax=Entamoeba invadens IP1 TaxID=370355 RepID=L7FMR1_ENTIV|nr:hypothetical protein EIN_413790 [Entamoeba invadens IP1]ELP91701.1 hypothetical protein EIN_413790 [Entamoeba invadens IP1]|eukprot:XP_004258472.1 hypothetical protein EIN_413790 [Entamoeba invadens IP1]
MSKLEIVYMMNVALYINTVESLKTFMEINKKCSSCLSGLYINPFIDVSVQSFSMFKEQHKALYTSIFLFLLKAFPKIETLQCVDYMLGDANKVINKVKKIRLVKTPHNRNRLSVVVACAHNHPKIAPQAILKIVNLCVVTKNEAVIPNEMYTSLESVQIDGWIRNKDLLNAIFGLPSVRKVTIWNCTHISYLNTIWECISEVKLKHQHKLDNVNISVFIEKSISTEIYREEFESAFLALKQLGVSVYYNTENVIDNCHILDESRFIGEVVVTNKKGLDFGCFKNDREYDIDVYHNREGYDKWMIKTRRHKNHEQEDRDDGDDINNDGNENENAIDSKNDEIDDINDDEKEKENDDITDNEEVEDKKENNENGIVVPNQNEWYRAESRYPITCPLVLLDDVIPTFNLQSRLVVRLTLFNITKQTICNLFCTQVTIEKCSDLTVTLRGVDSTCCINCSALSLVIEDFANTFLFRNVKNSTVESHSAYTVWSMVLNNSSIISIKNTKIGNLKATQTNNVTIAHCTLGNIFFDKCSHVSLDNTNKPIKTGKVKTKCFSDVTASHIHALLNGHFKVLNSQLSQFTNLPTNDQIATLVALTDKCNSTTEQEVSFDVFCGVVLYDGHIEMLSFVNQKTIPPFLTSENVDISISITNNSIKEVFIEKANHVFVDSQFDIQIGCGVVSSVVSDTLNVEYCGVSFDKNVASVVNSQTEESSQPTTSLIHVCGKVRFCGYLVKFNLDNYYYLQRTTQNVENVVVQMKKQKVLDFGRLPWKRIQIENENKGTYVADKLILNKNTVFLKLIGIKFKTIESNKTTQIEQKVTQKVVVQNTMFVNTKKTSVSWKECKTIKCGEKVEKLVVKSCELLEEIVIGENTQSVHLQSCKKLKRIVGKMRGVQIIAKNCPFLLSNTKHSKRNKITFMP